MMANDTKISSRFNPICRFVIRAGVIGTALIIVAALMGSGIAAGRPSAAATPTGHQVTFNNNCSQPIWIADLGSSDVVPKTWELARSCDPDAKNSCPAGSTCDGHRCTCKTPGPGAPECMGGLCGSDHLCVTSEVVNLPASYSGRFWPRTGCDANGTNCATGDCGGTDCFQQGKTANNATLWEMTLGPLPEISSITTSDDYDLSLVSGYNIPVDIVAHAPTDTPGWHPNSSYHNGQGDYSQSVIVAPAGQYHWLLNDVGTAITGTSGGTMPAFAKTLKSQVQDPKGSNGILWSTTSSTCQEGSCVSDLLATCPAVLQVKDKAGKVVACSAADTYCQANSGGSICTAQNQAFFLCLNSTSSGEKDPFGNYINLESPNGATPICFSSSDCAPGTKCVLNPQFTAASKVSFPAGAGICMPGNGQIPQNGGCTSTSMDGETCPSSNFTFPFPYYTCATVTNDGSGNDVSLCVPPITAKASGAAAFGELVWNADNFTKTSTQCTKDAGCSTGDYCLSNNVRQAKNGTTVAAQAVNQCTSSNPADCSCYSVKSCSTDAGCTGGTQCLDKQGKACGTGESCLCQTDAVYTGVCGATNVNWTDANNAIMASDGNNYLNEFKKVCPSAYSYQFDDASSNWTCGNTADQLTSYTVTFCGYGGKGLAHVTPAQP